MHILRLYTVTVQRFICIGSSFKEELHLQDIKTDGWKDSYIYK